MPASDAAAALAGVPSRPEATSAQAIAGTKTRQRKIFEPGIDPPEVVSVPISDGLSGTRSLVASHPRWPAPYSPCATRAAATPEEEPP